VEEVKAFVGRVAGDGGADVDAVDGH